MKRQITAARREILVLLRRHGPQTVDALAKLLGITPVGVRKHLDTLEIDGLVTAVTERRRVGRPVQVYSLTEAAEDLFPKAYGVLLESLLRQAERLGGDALVTDLVHGHWAEMLAAYRERTAAGAPLAERVAALARLRSELGCMAEWRQADGAWLLHEHNCTLCRVSPRFPQLCAQELAFIQDALGDAATVERVEHTAAGDRRCTYLIRARR